MYTAKAMKIVKLFLPEEFIEKLNKDAKEIGFSLSGIIRLIVINHYRYNRKIELWKTK